MCSADMRHIAAKSRCRRVDHAGQTECDWDRLYTVGTEANSYMKG
jgi:hypothetical protein